MPEETSSSHPFPCHGYAVHSASEPLAPFDFERRALGPHDVLIAIEYCGVCHSDIHQAHNDWGNARYPMVPGHEIIGTVKAIGELVSRHPVGSRVGVGCMVNSCRACANCLAREEQFCLKHTVMTYNDVEADMKTPTYGGYSDCIAVNEDFVLRIPESLDPASAAPLLCAGITTYSPLRHWKIGPGHKLAIAGFGGLGHIGVKIAHSMGIEVTVLSTSPEKEEDARTMGAQHFVNTNDPLALPTLHDSFDVIVNTMPVNYSLDLYLNALKANGVLISVGMPTQFFSLHPFSLQMKRRSLCGSFMGGIAETQEMLDYCGTHNIAASVELIKPDEINQAWENVSAKKARYRYVIDFTKDSQ
ncbi:MAG: NAD(P)-dependent alcohol dehydrogenase [bacterium]|nr:NAD(P)-dependent alcohol dehydrogenase [bacterium]